MTIRHAHIVEHAAGNAAVEQIAFVDSDGQPAEIGGSAPAAATTTTAGLVKKATVASDADVATLIAALKTAGVVTGD
jgi:hypothetical protein